MNWENEKWSGWIFELTHRSVWFVLLLVCWALPSVAQDALVVEESEAVESVLQPEQRLSEPELTGEVIYGHKVGMALTYDVIHPKNRNGAAVIFVVSGGWNSTYFPPQNFRQIGLLAKLFDAGYTLILMRHGSAPMFKVPEAVDDIRLGVRHVRANADRLGIEADRLGICGASAGGHLSLMIGATADEGSPRARSEVDRTACRVACVATYFPPTDLRGMVGPSDQFPALDFDKKLAEGVSPIALAKEGTAPTLMVHGTQDRLVPKHHSERLKSKLDEVNVPCELLILEGAGHGFRGKQAEEAEKAVLEWFAKFLSESKQ
jgi:acetyl esterase/lipase